MVPCHCGTKRTDLDEATLVLNGVPICNKECLAKAEKAARLPKDTIPKPRGWDCT